MKEEEIPQKIHYVIKCIAPKFNNTISARSIKSSVYMHYIYWTRFSRNAHKFVWGVVVTRIKSNCYCKELQGNFPKGNSLGLFLFGQNNFSMRSKGVKWGWWDWDWGKYFIVCEWSRIKKKMRFVLGKNIWWWSVVSRWWWIPTRFNWNILQYEQTTTNDGAEGSGKISSYWVMLPLTAIAIAAAITTSRRYYSSFNLVALNIVPTITLLFLLLSSWRNSSSKLCLLLLLPHGPEKFCDFSNRVIIISLFLMDWVAVLLYHYCTAIIILLERLKSELLR